MSGRVARNLLRSREGRDSNRVSFFELFFDIVFVFAITQLSHDLLVHYSAGGGLRAGLLFMAVWWVWISTSWCTNWLDPETTPVRLMLMLLMLGGLVLAIALPDAFETRGALFAGTYVAMQVGRSLFMLWALKRHNPRKYRNFQRITAWLLLSAAFWIAGAAAAQETRLLLWLIALGLEYISPAIGFWFPGLGRSTTADWDLARGHLAERCGLFIIIALGESIPVVGATFGVLATWRPVTMEAFVVAFFGSVAMWWIYFHLGAERARRNIATSADLGRLARLAYTYIHLPVVAGIVVGAVADELVLAHPHGHAGWGVAAAVLGGPALYLLGNLLFKAAIWGRVPLSHVVGLALLLACTALAGAGSSLVLATAAMAALVVVALWESVSLRGAPA